MKTDTRQKILGYIHTHKQARVHDLVGIFGISQVAVHRQLNRLLSDKQIKKIGRPPLVFYVPTLEEKAGTEVVTGDTKQILEANYLYISPKGELLSGWEGFVSWVKSIKQDGKLLELVQEYTKYLKDANTRLSPEGWLDASQKIASTFTNPGLDRLFYGDFYSLPKFGKTKLGQLVLYAKQSQNKELVKQVVLKARPVIEALIKEFSIEAVGFIPPTVPRKMQFMDELKDQLNLKIPTINLVKVAPGEVVVAQKTLSSLEERIENAQMSIFMKDNRLNFSRVLLIDDAAGSGATFNETAGKLKAAMVGGKKLVVGFAIVGSLKGFDVIREI